MKISESNNRRKDIIKRSYQGSFDGKSWVEYASWTPEEITQANICGIFLTKDDFKFTRTKDNMFNKKNLIKRNGSND